MFFATGGFVGNLPLAPGTFGSLIGLPICFFLTKLPAFVSAILIGLFALAAVGISGRAETMLNTKDPGCIVIDEVAGQMVTLFGLPFNFPVVMGGFLVFAVWISSSLFPFAGWKGAYPADSELLRTISWPG